MNGRLFLLFLFLVFFIAGCSSSVSDLQSQHPVYDKVSLDEQLVSCIVFSEHIECTLVNGRIYYATMNKINGITKWDCSAWANGSC